MGVLTGLFVVTFTVTLVLATPEKSDSNTFTGDIPLSKRRLTDAQVKDILLDERASRILRLLLEKSLRSRMQNRLGGVYQHKKAFWQPMNGPLPVQTRIASFGSRIEPNREAQGPAGFKAMRYGR